MKKAEQTSQKECNSALVAMFPAGFYPPHTPEMRKIMDELRAIVANPVVEAAYNDAIAHVDPYIQELGTQQVNPWTGTTVEDFVCYFDKWFTFLPEPKSGLGFIVPLTFFYLNNPQGFFFMNLLQSKSGTAKTYTKEIFNWSVSFVKERGRFMDSPASAYYVKDWLTFLGPQINDYIVPTGGYKTFNEFFTRSLNMKNNPRPISAPDDNSVLVASADTEINFIETNLTLKTSLPVKTREINVDELLNHSQFAKHFVGGTAISCVLLPTNYHHYHAPVTGNIVEGMEVPGIYNGIMDGEHWFNEGNIGESDTKFSIFEDFHRAYFIFDTEDFGYVAMIPVGLNTISSINATMVDGKSPYVNPDKDNSVYVKKGQPLGYFAYGGSLNILLFQANVIDGISVLQGQRIGTMSKVKKQ